MDSFSPAALNSLATSITNHAVSSISELQSLLPSMPPQDIEAKRQIASLLSTVSESMGQVKQLQQALRNATVISVRLQGILTETMSSCDSALARCNKQSMRLNGENMKNIDPAYVEAQITMLTTYQSLFQNLLQTLSLNDMGSQDSNLNTFAAQGLIQQAATATQTASQITSILLDEANTQNSLPAFSNLAHRPKNQPLGQDEPPPYAPTDPSSSASHHVPTPTQSEAGPSTTPQSSGFSFGKAFKAITQSFMPKADPFVNALCEAVKNGDIQQITGLLAQGININGKGEEGNTPLQCAITANQEEAVTVLLSAGANFSSSGGWGGNIPPMFQAAAAGRIGIAKLIMDKGVKATEQSMSGQPYFVDVCNSGNIDGVRFLLDHGAKPSTSSISGRPVLIQAVRQNNIELVELLIKYGAKVNVSDISGSSILAVAADKDDLRLVQLLLDHDAKPDGTTVTGTTVLVDSISRRRLDLARLLLDHGAKGKKDDISGQAIILGLIKDTKIKPEDKVDLVRRLLENGASPNAKDNTWDIPVLCFAIDSGIPEIVELLLEHGAKTKAKTSSGEPVLIYAVDNGKMTEARMLLEHGADANGANKQGKTPLMEAVIKQDVGLIKLLMDHGADVNATGSVSIATFAGALRRPDILHLLGLEGAGSGNAPPEYQSSTKS